MKNREFIESYFSEMKGIIENMPVEDIDRAVEVLFDALQRGSQVFTCGNGGSASTASHFACDLNKKAGIKSISLNYNIPLITAITNDYGWNYVYEEQLKMLGA